MSALVIRRPDDWHLHLRDGAALGAVLPFTAARFARAIVMPNLNPPVTTTAAALAYRERIRAALPAGVEFEPLMTLYLTDGTPAEEIARAQAAGLLGCKLYPAGATTHSAAGVTDVRRLDAVFERMAEAGLVLQVHGEVTDPAVDVFEREARFIDTVLAPLAARHSRLRIVFEHISTRAAVVRGSPRLFLGTDSAPHARAAKEAACGCAGIFSAHAGIELYAEVFAAAGALGKLEAFAADFGADFYGLARNRDTITLVPEPWEVPARYPFGTEELVPLRAGERVAWRLVP